MKYKIILCVVLSLCLLLTSCGGIAELPGDEVPTTEPDTTEPSNGPNDGPGDGPNDGPGEPEKHYEVPPFAYAVFHDCAENNGVKLDLSATAEGYVAVSAVSDARLKFQVLKDDVTYTYDIGSDGAPSVFPLQSGNGTYTFRVMENVAESKYAVKYATDAEVNLKDEFQPYIRPSEYADYTEDSACVKLASGFSAEAGDELDVVSAVFDYICESVTYDKEKAETVKSGYLPDPDETLASGKGICFDYASLAAAMLRSQGIPTKVIFGYVSPNDLYHAWNMFYTKETGWVTVEYEVSADTWNRLDLTFSANEADETFIIDGANYTDVYIY